MALCKAFPAKSEYRDAELGVERSCRRPATFWLDGKDPVLMVDDMRSLLDYSVCAMHAVANGVPIALLTGIATKRR